jgi:hypothetical protein
MPVSIFSCSRRERLHLTSTSKSSGDPSASSFWTRRYKVPSCGAGGGVPCGVTTNKDDDYIESLQLGATKTGDL